MADITKRYNRKYDEPMNHREQAELYYNVLSRSGAAATFFCTINEDKKYGQYCTRNESAFVDQFDKHWNNENCYIPLNLFSGEYRYNKKKQKRGWFRTEQDVVAVNGILVDFDIMKNKGKNPNISYTIKAGDELVEGLVDEMNDLVDDGKMVYPTLLTKSGRGLQYIMLYEDPISKSDEEAMFKHKRLYKKITTYLQSLYDKDLVEVDTAVTDAPRICRLPGTRHLKNDRFAELVEYNPNCMYDLDELCELFEVDLSPEEKKKPGRPRKEKTDKKEKKNKKQKVYKEYHPVGPEELPNLTKYQKNNVKSRIAMMEKLAKIRGMKQGDGREVMCFWYYNYQRQVAVPVAAMQKTKMFNRSFAEPLSDAELFGCIERTQNHEGDGAYPDGYYVCSKETLIAKLCMSEEEIKATGAYKKKEEIERAAKNHAKKVMNKQFLFAMFKNKDLKKSQIVKALMEHTGMSSSTAYRWVDEMEQELDKKVKEAIVEKLESEYEEVRYSYSSDSDTRRKREELEFFSRFPILSKKNILNRYTKGEFCPILSGIDECYEKYSVEMSRLEAAISAINYEELYSYEHHWIKDGEILVKGELDGIPYRVKTLETYSNCFRLVMEYGYFDRSGGVSVERLDVGTLEYGVVHMLDYTEDEFDVEDA